MQRPRFFSDTLRLRTLARTPETVRWVRESVAVFVDILIAFPVLIIAMMISAVWGGSLWVVIWSVGIGFGVNIARVLNCGVCCRATSCSPGARRD